MKSTNCQQHFEATNILDVLTADEAYSGWYCYLPQPMVPESDDFVLMSDSDDFVEIFEEHPPRGMLEMAPLV